MEENIFIGGAHIGVITFYTGTLGLGQALAYHNNFQSSILTDEYNDMIEFCRLLKHGRTILDNYGPVCYHGAVEKEKLR